VKGFGFIKPDDGALNDNKDLFVHYHHIVNRQSYKSLKQGDEVEFYLGQNSKGKCASEVKIIKPIELVEEKSEAVQV